MIDPFFVSTIDYMNTKWVSLEEYLMVVNYLLSDLVTRAELVASGLMPEGFIYNIQNGDSNQ